MRYTFTFISVAMLALVAVTPARAQEEGTKTPVAQDQMISASPILWVFKWFNADYERKINSTTTWGVSGSYLPIGDAQYSRASVLVRYYPQRAALTGFYVGGQTGVYRITDSVYNAPRTAVRRHETLYGAGVDLGHAWLFGPSRNIGVSLGFGVSRVFAGDLEGASFVIPNARLLNVGIAF